MTKALTSPTTYRQDIRSDIDGPDTSTLASRLLELAEVDDDEYWSFIGRGDRDYLHGLMRYPAMMVPHLQRELMQACVEWDNSIDRIYDPFVGSGTVMTEAMLLGRSFVGTDINPLAVLLCRAKSEYLDAAALSRDLARLLADLDNDRNDAVDVTFPNMTKWFEPHVLIGLARLRRAILNRPYGRTRRFWWVVLAEVIRLASNSRTSTVKLHKRPEIEIANRPDPVARFKEVALQSIDLVAAQEVELLARGHLDGARYTRELEIAVADACEHRIEPADLLVSSPPYGDNHTTVTYGQASFLAMQWIPTADIGDRIDSALFASTHATDTASLGGSRRDALPHLERLLDRSASLRNTFDKLQDQPRDRRVRVAAFFRDFDLALDTIVGNLRDGAVMVWTVGDRSVGGQRIPLTDALEELLGSRASCVTRLSRAIPASTKRMPTRNSVTDTMAAETILVLRKEKTD